MCFQPQQRQAWQHICTTTPPIGACPFNHWSYEWLFFCFFIPNPSQVKPVNFLFSLNIFEECYHVDGIISDFSFDLYIIFCLYTGRKYLQITFFQGKNSCNFTLFQGKNSWIFTLFQGKNSHYFTLFQDSTRLWQRIPRAEGNAPKGNMRSRHAPKGQRAHSPGQPTKERAYSGACSSYTVRGGGRRSHRPGYDEAMKCALKGQKR